MDRSVRTVLASVATGATLVALLLPGRAARRVLDGLAASFTAVACLGAGFKGANELLQRGQLEAATAVGLLTVAAVIQVPAWLLARRDEVSVERARGVVLLAAVLTCFVAAWVAGPRVVAPGPGGGPAAPSEVTGELHPVPPAS